MGEITTEELRRRYEAGERDFRGLDLSEIQLFGTFADSNFTNVDFRCVEISICSFIGCDLSGVDFRGAHIVNALIIEGCVFTNLNLSNIFGNALICKEGDFRGVQLSRISLSYGSATGCDLRGIDLSESLWWNADFSSSSFEGAKLAWSDLRGSNFEGVDFTRADLRGVDFTRAKLMDSDCTAANLRAAILTRANLTRACLNDANLCGAWLEDAILCEAILSYTKGTNAILKGANFKGAETSCAPHLYKKYFLRGAILWNTILPDGELFIGPEPTYIGNRF